MDEDNCGEVEVDDVTYGSLMIHAALMGMTVQEVADYILAEWRRLGRPDPRKPWGEEKPIGY